MGASEPVSTRISSEIGERIARRRRSKGLSQERLAALTGVTRESVRLYEIGERCPRADTLLAMAVVLNTTVEELMPERYGDRFDPLRVFWSDVASGRGSSRSSGASNEPTPIDAKRRDKTSDLKFRFRDQAA